MNNNFFKILTALAIISALATGCTNLNNMINNHPTDVRYVQTPDPMVTDGDVLQIRITGEFAPNYFHRRAGMVFQPELQHEGGSVLLRPIVLIGESVTDLQGGTILRIGGRFAYTDEVPFTPELKEARLVVHPVVFPARRARGNVPATAVEAMTFRNAGATEEITIASGVRIVPQEVNLADAESRETNLADVGLSLGSNICTETGHIFVKSVLFFERDLSNVNINYGRNREEKLRLAREINDEFLRTGQKIASVRILGWASPEGGEARNARLGTERARAGERFFREQYARAVDDMVREHNRNLPRGERRVTARDIKQDFPIIVEYMGEDWNGFLTAIRASDIRDREAILRVFETNIDRNHREEELRSMLAIYPELQDVILPSLRRVEIVVEFIADTSY